MDNYIIVSCPHCNDLIYIEKNEFNCHIFRHGIYKNSHKQIDPHLDKKSCIDITDKNLIYGCGKPFKLVYDKNTYSTIVCDYI
jgi:hypothetical protein